MWSSSHHPLQNQGTTEYYTKNESRWSSSENMKKTEWIEFQSADTTKLRKTMAKGGLLITLASVVCRSLVREEYKRLSRHPCITQLD
jgi:hypothetical protein